MNTETLLQQWLEGSVISLLDYEFKHVLPNLQCADGSTLSVQASENHYCSPRTNTGPYRSVEVYLVRITSGEIPDAWYECRDTDDHDPFAYIPINLVVELIDAHGGIDIAWLTAHRLLEANPCP